uniref:GPI ethanolamine phosphate transferase 2 C-terminal domain-containing protein n=1 Tax=Timema genevievae TaxID=629358 RepID=A0A7R9JVI3_TIMGE|nr:unnamed protein product [Timema genevievae]
MSVASSKQIFLLMTLAVYALLLFLYGFFPLKIPDKSVSSSKDLPHLVGNVSVNATELYKPMAGKLVIMVIDALRWDFIGGDKGPHNMPYTLSLVMNDRACLLEGRADPPTVTMPRIKALTTGTVPNFIDVVLNLASPEISEDSILRQAMEHGNKIVFYGDDTWLKLFPDSFIRSEGTTSFFVSDFTEVDDNVTRHLASELNSPDWDIMILHYLGLDHIGHLEGPESRHVGPKLHEMDDVVRRIHQQLVIWVGSNGCETTAIDATSELPSVMVVCGDHGMKDSGSHGGASLEEVLVPIITIGLNCPGQDLSLLSVSQVDLVPTLAVMLALPIPAANLGKLISPLLHTLPPTRRLYSLHYNSKQVAEQFRRQAAAYRTQGPYLDYEEAMRLHSDWLMQEDPELVPRIVALYTSSLADMSSQLVKSMARFDLHALVIASFILWQVFALLLVDANAPSWEHVLLGTLLSLGVHSMGCALGGGNSFLCCLGLNSGLFLAIFTAVVVAVNCCVLTSCWPQYVELCQKFPRGGMKRFLLLGTVLHSVSLASSSFIEEEHQVWYFLFLTFSLVTLACLYKSLMPSEALYGGFLLVLHRILRKLNQTGDKWASLPDIGDWLVQPGQETFLTAVFLLGLLGVCVSCHYLNTGSSRRDLVLYSIAAAYIYCYRAATGSVLLPFTYPLSRGVTEVMVFWGVLCVLVVKSVVNVWHNNDSPLGVITCTCALVSALLHRPHAVLLVPAQVLCSAHIHRACLRMGVRWNTIAHIWLGWLFFFYQGNSNSLASIDVASGYVGLESYSLVTVGLQLVLHTYSAPILSHILLINGVEHNARKGVFPNFRKHLVDVYTTSMYTRVLPLATFSVLVLAQRYHLFVWSVFSPKLLYETMHTIVIFTLLVVTEVCFQFHNWKLKKYHSEDYNRYLQLPAEYLYTSIIPL